MKDGEAFSLTPISSPPICNEAVKTIRTGTSHTAFITGKSWLILDEIEYLILSFLLHYGLNF